MRMSAILLLLLSVSGLVAATSNLALTSRIPRVQVSSSAISRVGYSRRQRLPEIEFPNGAVYRYLEVPAQSYGELMAVSSKAGYCDNNIRHHFHSIHVKPLL